MHFTCRRLFFIDKHLFHLVVILSEAKNLPATIRSGDPSQAQDDRRCIFTVENDRVDLDKK